MFSWFTFFIREVQTLRVISEFFLTCFSSRRLAPLFWFNILSHSKIESYFIWLHPLTNGSCERYFIFHFLFTGALGKFLAKEIHTCPNKKRLLSEIERAISFYRLKFFYIAFVSSEDKFFNSFLYLLLPVYYGTQVYFSASPAIFRLFCQQGSA